LTNVFTLFTFVVSLFNMYLSNIRNLIKKVKKINKMENVLTDEQLTKLRESMPKGFAKTLAKKSNCSIPFVWQVFKNESKNFDLTKKVITEALKLKTSFDTEKEKLRQKVALN